MPPRLDGIFVPFSLRFAGKYPTYGRPLGIGFSKKRLHPQKTPIASLRKESLPPTVESCEQSAGSAAVLLDGDAASQLHFFKLQTEAQRRNISIRHTRGSERRHVGRLEAAIIQYDKLRCDLPNFGQAPATRLEPHETESAPVSTKTLKQHRKLPPAVTSFRYPLFGRQGPYPPPPACGATHTF